VHGFWPVEELAEQAEELTGCGKGRGVGVYFLGTSVWQGELYFRRRREWLDQTCRCISDSLL